MPVAAAGGAVSLVDVIVFVTLLAIVVILWSLVQVRQPISGLPIIGGPGVNLIDGMRKTVTDWANALLTFFDAQQALVTDLWTRFINQAVNPAFAGFQKGVVTLGLQLEALVRQTIPALAHDIAQLQLLTVRQLLPQVGALTSRVAQDEDYAQRVLAAGLATTGAQLAAAEQEIAQLRSQVAQLVQGLVVVGGAVAGLGQYERLLRDLQGLESTTAGGVTSLGQEQAAQGGRIAGAEGDIQRLAVLSGLAALTAAQVATLVRVARDPCGICQGLDLATVEQRLSNLELWGEL